MDTDYIFSINALISGQKCVELDGHRQDEDVVVVGVFADQVHATGCGDNPTRRTPELFRKIRGDLRGEFLDFHGERGGQGFGGVLRPRMAPASIPPPKISITIPQMMLMLMPREC